MNHGLKLRTGPHPGSKCPTEVRIQPFPTVPMPTAQSMLSHLGSGIGYLWPFLLCPGPLEPVLHPFYVRARPFQLQTFPWPRVTWCQSLGSSSAPRPTGPCPSPVSSSLPPSPPGSKGPQPLHSPVSCTCSTVGRGSRFLRRGSRFLLLEVVPKAHGSCFAIASQASRFGFSPLITVLLCPLSE